MNPVFFFLFLSDFLELSLISRLSGVCSTARTMNEHYHEYFFSVFIKRSCKMISSQLFCHPSDITSCHSNDLVFLSFRK